MHAALWKLLWFDLCGSFRSIANVRRSWRKLLMLALIVLMLCGFLAARNLSTNGVGASRFGQAMPFWALAYLLATWLTASADRGLVMRPAEIHFVAGGPFRDRDVITLNLVRLAFRAATSALILALVSSAYLPSFPSAFVGIWMLIAVSLLVGMVASLASRRSLGASVRWLKRAFTLVALGSVLLLIVQSLQHVRTLGVVPDMNAIAAGASQSQLGRWLLMPLAWMFRPITATFSETMTLIPPRLGIIGLLALLIYVLGGSYLETSTNKTDQSIARRAAALRSGSSGGSMLLSRFSLPMLPSLGGIGGVAWMQIVHSLRILPRYFVFTTAIVGVVLVIPLMVDRHRLSGFATSGWMAGLTAYADFLLLLQLPVGFLGPVAQREMLKSLPVSAWRVVLGQLAGPIIPIGLLHLLITILFLFLVPDNRLLVVQTSLALIPAAVLVITNVNLLGSWNIIRPRALQQRDALAAGRAMISVWIFFGMLIPAIITSVLFSMLFRDLLGPSPASTMFGAALGGMLISPAYVALLARSFARWQPSPSDGGKEEAELDR